MAVSATTRKPKNWKKSNRARGQYRDPVTKRFAVCPHDRREAPEWQAGMMRTDMQCTNCLKDFIARLDAGLDGDQVVLCPYCNHAHYRRVKNGEVTESRWGTQGDSKAREADAQRCAPPIVTTTAAAFVRERWLNFGE